MVKSVILSAAALVPLAAAALYPGVTTDNHTCILSEPVLSCSADAVPEKVDTCCSETYGGLLLQTQFWDIYTGYESEGQILPQKSWTIHGLWPDFCNGSYAQYCDLSRQYDPKPSPNTTDGTPSGTPVPAYTGESIDKWFAPYGKLDLLAWMNKYWIGQNDPNWVLWAHEYSKHATCYSTFQTECFGPKASKYDDMFDFFETVIGYYKDLPTWRWLADAGIKPSNTTSYSLSDIQAAIKKSYGKVPYLGCGGPRFNETAAGKGSGDDGRTQFQEVWYYNHVVGRVQNKDVVRVDADVVGGSLGNCAKAENAIWYYKRAKGSETTGCQKK